jgi:hypothetical protein
MMKSTLILALFFSLFSFAETESSAIVSENNLSQVCEASSLKKMSYYEATKKKIQDKVSKLKKASPEWIEFEDSEQYDWLRFAVYNGLPSYAKARRDKCSALYEIFVAEKRPLAADEKFTSWKNCLEVQFKDVMPEMAQKLINCHTNATKKPDSEKDNP